MTSHEIWDLCVSDFQHSDIKINKLIKKIVYISLHNSNPQISSLNWMLSLNKTDLMKVPVCVFFL